MRKDNQPRQALFKEKMKEISQALAAVLPSANEFRKDFGPNNLISGPAPQDLRKSVAQPTTRSSVVPGTDPTKATNRSTTAANPTE